MISIPPQKLRALHKYYTHEKDRYTGHSLEGERHEEPAVNNIEKTKLGHRYGKILWCSRDKGHSGRDSVMVRCL